MPTVKEEVMAYARQYIMRPDNLRGLRSSPTLDGSNTELWNLAVSNEPLY